MIDIKCEKCHDKDFVLLVDGIRLCYECYSKNLVKLADEVINPKIKINEH